MTTKELWQAVLGEIELSISKASFTTWFKNTGIQKLTDDSVVICVPNIEKNGLKKNIKKIFCLQFKNTIQKSLFLLARFQMEIKILNQKVLIRL